MRVVVDGVENSVAELKHVFEFRKACFSVGNAHAVCVRHKVNVLYAGEFDKNIVLIADVSESSFCFDGFFCNVETVYDDFAFGIGQYPRDAFQSRGFTRAVVSQKTGYLAGIADNVQIVHRRFLSRMVLFCQMLDFQTRRKVLFAIHSFDLPCSY